MVTEQRRRCMEAYDALISRAGQEEAARYLMTKEIEDALDAREAEKEPHYLLEAVGAAALSVILGAIIIIGLAL